MNMIRIECDACGREQEFSASQAGQKVECECGQELIVPPPADPAAADSSPDEAPPPPDPAAKWYYSAEGEARGPLPLADMRELVLQSQLGPQDKVYGPNTGDWKEVKEVPELADFLPAAGPSSASTPTPSRPSRSAPRGRPSAKHSSKLPLIIGVVVLLVAGAGAFVFLAGRGGETPSNTQTAGTATADHPTEKPHKTDEKSPGETLKKWAVLFARESPEKVATAPSLTPFYPSGSPDVLGITLQNELRKAVGGDDPGRALRIEELPRKILRARDGKTFCYHAPLPEGQESVTVRAKIAVENGIETVGKRFDRDDFEPVRCFAVRRKDGPSLASARIVTTNSQDEPKVLAFGRAGHVGTKAGVHYIRYLTGTRSASRSEADSLLVAGGDRIPDLVVDEPAGWTAYGELMSVDSGLVSQRTFDVRAEEDPEDRILIYRKATGKALSEVTSRYGHAPTVNTLNVSTIYHRVVGEGNPDAASGLQVHRYGPFGLGIDPETEEIVAFVFEKAYAQERSPGR